MPSLRMLQPIKIRGMELKNRVIMAPMETNIGVRNRKARAYYNERAIGGAGLITISGMSLDLYIDDDVWGKPGAAARFLEGCNLLAGDIHQSGAKLAAQLIHLSRIPSGTGLYDDRGEPIAPSPREDVPRDVVSAILAKKGLIKKVPCRELTVPEIQGIVAKFGRAAAAVKSAGFDMVEFHGSHGYMPSQFFSPADNHRTDKYGGDLKGRARFGVECVQAMRAAVGNDFPICARIGGYEYRKGGITPDQAADYAALLEHAGADIISVSVGGTDRPRGYSNYVAPSPEFPLGCYADFAQAVKRKVKVAVAAVGRIHTQEIAEEILGQGKADLLALGRQLIADPHWVRKIASGHPEDVVPCQSCNTCMESLGRESGFRCTVNAAAGKEADYVEKPVEKPKKVWVIGGGPAGMEAARVAALRGHQVTLWEKEKELGGQLLVADL
ncbi:MAG: NAD(P)/FAD-dependent oxidoreductase, partial [Dehalococcoidia bacterium]|nr:NAD(P)/FAD-dependent oxidoreductase [Dehalococcoidia bacterium]